MDNKKQHALNFIKVIVFLGILFLVFLYCTYLFRNTGRHLRQTVVEYYDEEENSLDVVFIGASNVMRYWDPMGAWETYGFTSRNHAATAMSASTYLAALKDALKTQTPEVVVVEARLFAREGELKGNLSPDNRNFLDAMDFDLDRLKAVHYACEVLEIPKEDRLPMYIDLIQYHSNWDALLKKRNWEMAGNRMPEAYGYANVFKGYGILDQREAFADPSANLTEECLPVDEIGIRLFTDVIEYCQEKEVPLMFLASPMVITEEEAGWFNTLEEIAESYGVPFMDTNHLYEEMGVDFSTDFADVHHMNTLGADKFTRYVGKYLKETYDLPDHREDPAYESWQNVYKKYAAAVETARETLQSAQ